MLRPTYLHLGADPETFVEQHGRIIGSERVIPEAGLRKAQFAQALVVQDGIQVELNPMASASTNMLADQLASAFSLLLHQLTKFHGATLCWDGLVEVTREELDGLSPKSRILGCQPSENVYGPRPITVDPLTYRKRSAGGHMHFGMTMQKRLYDERKNVIPLLDIFVGNSGVLLDRDPGQAERRENYGRAGEFRFQPHGIEYRTPSNFWLRSYALMTFVYGMADVAFSVLSNRLMNWGDVEQELIDTVNIDNVIQAIDTNDYELARTNFDVLRPFLVKHLPEYGFPLNPNTIDKFLTFTDDVQKNGIRTYFPMSPEVHWTSLMDRVEFSTYLRRR